jgi:hypothetical protein
MKKKISKNYDLKQFIMNTTVAPATSVVAPRIENTIVVAVLAVTVVIVFYVNRLITNLEKRNNAIVKEIERITSKHTAGKHT